jgi:hypothetical protein
MFVNLNVCFAASLFLGLIWVSQTGSASGLTLAMDDDHSGKAEAGPSDGAFVDSLWELGAPASPIGAPQAKKRQYFTDLNKPAKRRVDKLIRVAFSGGDGADEPPDPEKARLSIQAALYRTSSSARDSEAKSQMFDEICSAFRTKKLRGPEQAVKRVIVDQLAKGVEDGLYSQRQVWRATGIHRDTLRSAARRKNVDVGQSLTGDLDCGLDSFLLF